MLAPSRRQVVPDERRVLGHHHGDADAQQHAVIGQPQGVVAGRSRDHALPPLLFTQEQQGIAGPAFLEAASPLQVVELAIGPAVSNLRERNRLRTRRQIDPSRNALFRFDDIAKSHVHGRPQGCRWQTANCIRPGHSRTTAEWLAMHCQTPVADSRCFPTATRLGAARQGLPALREREEDS